MRILFLTILLLTGSAWSSSESHCHQVDGIYKNSKSALEDLKFESLVDIFSFNSAKNFTLKVGGEEMRFYRTSIDVSRNTKMEFERKGTRATAIVQMDRTPQAASKSRAFYGNLFITNDLSYLTYNFYCTF